MKLTLVAVKVPDDIPEDEIDLFCCESCYFEEVCMQTEFPPSEIRQCDKEGQNFYWELEKDNG